METRAIEVREPLYERLDAFRREDESFGDAIDRILDEGRGDWRQAFGKYDGERGERLREIVSEQRRDTGSSGSGRPDHGDTGPS